MSDTIKLLSEYVLLKDLWQSVSHTLDQEYYQWASQQKESRIELLGGPAQFSSPLIRIQENLTQRVADLRNALAKDLGLDLQEELK